MIRSPAIWIITAMVVGFTVWLLWTSSPAPLETASDRTGTQQGDRDSAAEEVRAVATQITEISDKIEDIEERQSGETDRIRQETEQSIAGIRETVESLKDQNWAPSEVVETLAQIGDRLTSLEISLDDGGRVDFEYPVGSSESPSIIWIEPLNAPESAALGVDGIGDLIPTDVALRGEEPPADPRYTIPPSSIVYATALTSLVGRIPVNGRLRDALALQTDFFRTEPDIAAIRSSWPRRCDLDRNRPWRLHVVVCIRNNRHNFVCLRRWLGSHPAFSCRPRRHNKRDWLDIGRAWQSLHQRRPEDECSTGNPAKRSCRHLLRPGTGICERAVHPHHRFQRQYINDCDGRFS